MKTLTFLSAVIASAALNYASAQTIAQWGFELNTPPDVTDTNLYAGLMPDIGSGSGLGLHASSASDWTTPAGNGSANSFSVNTWAVGDRFQFTVATTGYTGIGVSFDQTSSGTGPRDFGLEYSTDGSTFTAFAGYSVLPNAAPNPVWNSSVSSSLYSYNFDLSAITALNNAPNVYFRLVNVSTISANGGTVATGGTSRIDNFAVYVVPEPTGLAVLGGLMLFVGRRLVKRS